MNKKWYALKFKMAIGWDQRTGYYVENTETGEILDWGFAEEFAAVNYILNETNKNGGEK